MQKVAKSQKPQMKAYNSKKREGDRRTTYSLPENHDLKLTSYCFRKTQSFS